MKKLIKTLAMMLVAFNLFSTSFFVCFAEGDNFASESLNNIHVEGYTAHKKASSSDVKTNIRVKMTAQGETAKLYKLASIEYDSATGKYLTPEWDDKIILWLKAQENYSTDGEIKSAYSNPEHLGAASQSTWDEFFRDLLSKNSDINIIEHGYDTGADEEKLVECDSKTVTDPSNFNIEFNNVTIGIYAIVASAGESSARVYNPVVVDAIPQHKGPGNDYFLPELIDTKLKAAEATVDKRINDKDSDSVYVNEQVRFNINMTLPTLYADRVTLNRTRDRAYKFRVVDIMSQAFELADEPEFKLKYSFGKRGEPGFVEGVFVNEPETYWAIADSTYLPKEGEIVKELKQVAEGSVTEDKNFTEYVYDLTDLSELGTGTFYAVQKTEPLYTLKVDDEKTENGETVITMNLNMSVLKAKVAAGYSSGSDSNSFSLANATFSLEYLADVTDKIEIASEANTNTATVYYENNEVSDTARAYTYGAQVIKIDGSTAEDELKTYLKGAKFRLYKEVCTYLDSTPESSSDLFMFEKAMDNSITTDPYSAQGGYAAIKADFDSKGKLSRYYVFETSYDEAGQTDLGVNYVADQKIGRVFELCENGFIDGAKEAFDGSFESVDNKEGVTIKGLSEGNYILMETEAPFRYNELAEDIFFSINRLNDEEAKLEHNGSLAFFTDMDDNLVESGVITIDVLNFKGLTLPSTGGKGVKLFTFLGLGLMVSAMILIIVRNNKHDASYYM